MFYQVVFSCMVMVTVTVALRLSNHACEGQQLHLQCEYVDQVIMVRRAVYGRASQELCNLHENSSSRYEECRDPRSTVVVNNACAGKESCKIAASDLTFRDRCPFVYKYLKVDYECFDKETFNYTVTEWKGKATCSTIDFLNLEACTREHLKNIKHLFESPLMIVTEESRSKACQPYQVLKYCMENQTIKSCVGSQAHAVNRILDTRYSYICQVADMQFMKSNKVCLETFVEKSTTYKSCNDRYKYEISEFRDAEPELVSCAFINASITFANCISSEVDQYCKLSGQKIAGVMVEHLLDRTKKEHCFQLMAEFNGHGIATKGMDCPGDSFGRLTSCDATSSTYSQLYLFDTTPYSIIPAKDCDSYKSMVACKSHLGQQCHERQEFFHQAMIEIFYEINCKPEMVKMKAANQACIEELEQLESLESCKEQYVESVYSLYSAGGGFQNHYFGQCSFISAMRIFTTCPELVRLSSRTCYNFFVDIRKHYTKKYESENCNGVPYTALQPHGAALTVWICNGAEERLECPDYRYIQIQEAMFGITYHYICNNKSEKENDNCQPRVTTQHWVFKTCDGKQNCSIQSCRSKDLNTDLCLGFTKNLKIVYTCERNPATTPQGSSAYIEYFTDEMRPQMITHSQTNARTVKSTSLETDVVATGTVLTTESTTEGIGEEDVVATGTVLTTESTTEGIGEEDVVATGTVLTTESTTEGIGEEDVVATGTVLTTESTTEGIGEEGGP